jgi:DNA-binding IclR family transcriptional regulator
MTKKAAVRPAKTARNSGEAAAGEATSRYSAPALEKGLEILEVLADAPDGYTLNELAQVLGRTMSEIFRMAVTLVARGWVLQGSDDRYQLSLHMFELANRHRPFNTLLQSALPLMRNFSKQSRQSVHLSVMDRDCALVMAQTDAPGTWCFSVRVGTRVSLLRSGSGLVLLAFQDPAALDRLLAAQTPDDLPHTGTPAALRKRIAQVRQLGHASSPSHQLKGVVDLAVPVLGRTGEVLAAMVCPFMERIDGGNAVDMAASVALLREAAAELSKDLGFVTPAVSA